MRFTLLLAFSLILSSMNAQSHEQIQSITGLINVGKIDEAIAAYEALPEHESADIYYNLGNLYQQQNDIAKAALNYERAIKLDKRHKQAHNNLDMIREETDLDIIPVEEMFLLRWWKGLAGILSANAWAFVSILLAAALVFLLYCWWMPQSYMTKKRAFLGSVALPLVLLLVLALGNASKNLGDNKDYAIILNDEYDMHEGADDRSPINKDILAGTKVKIIDRIGDWIKVLTADTETGWVKASEVEVI